MGHGKGHFQFDGQFPLSPFTIILTIIIISVNSVTMPQNAVLDDDLAIEAN